MAEIITYVQSKLSSPIPLTDLKIWLRSDAGITKDASNYVSGWADQSGNGNGLTQTSGSAQPLFVENALNGKPSVKFSPSKYFNFPNNALLPFTNNGTTFYVLKKSDLAAGFVNYNAYYHFVDYYGTTIYIRNSDYITFNDGGLTQSYCCITVLGTNTGFKLYINNNQVETEKQLTLNSVMPYYGGDPAYFSGTAYHLEVIHYGRRLSDSEKTSVYNYLKSKYGL